MPTRRSSSKSGRTRSADSSVSNGGHGASAEIIPRIAREFLNLQHGGLLAAEVTKHLIEIIPAPLYTCDREGRIELFNQAAQELWGREPESADRWCGSLTLLRDNGTKLPHADSPTAMAVRSGKASVGLELIVVRGDGSRRHVVPHARPLLDAAGAITGAITLLMDVTERRVSEQDARAVAARLSFALEAGRMGDWTWDAATNALRLTGRAAEIFGIASGAEISRADMRALLHPDDVERAQRIVQTAMAARTDYDMEYRLRQASGEYVWVAVKGRGIYDARGELTTVVGTIQEISDRKAAEEKLRAREAQLQFISSNAPTLLSHVDREGRILFVSKAFADRWKTSPEAMTGRLLEEVIGHSAWLAIQPHLWRVLNGDTVEFESEIEYRELGRRYIKGTYSPEFGSDGHVRGWLSAAIDITDRWRAEQALRETEERFRLAAKSGKLGVWDWDIRNDEVTWSDSLYDIHGVSRDGFANTVEAFANLIHPDDRKPVERAIKCSLEHDVPYELEFRAVRPGGTVVWLFTNATVVRECGRPVRMLGATIDITARKHAELALRESEVRFRALASHAPVGIFLTDINGDALFVNETWRAIAGLGPDQIRGKGWVNALHPDDRERVSREWYEAVEAKHSFMSEYRFQRPDGHITWLQGSAVEFRNASGALVGYLGSVMDITQRKLAEDALRESERRFRTLASHAPVGIFLTDAHGETIFVNESWCRMAGLNPVEARGRGWSRAMHPDDRARVATEWTRALAENRSSSAEYRFLRSDGTLTWVQGNAVQLRDETGALMGYIGTVADLTARRAAEERLRAQEAQLRQLADSMPQIVFAADAQGKTDYYNRRWYEFTGAKEGVTGDESFVPILHPDDRQRCLDTWYACVASGEPYQIEYRFRFPARDEYRWHLGRALPVRDAQGKIVRWFGTCTDIHDWKLVQEELRRAQNQLQAHADDLERRVAERTASLREAIVQMEEFSYSVSHDLRAPLRAMNAYAQALVEDYGPQLDATAQSYLDRIQRSSLRMEKLTHDVLTFSRVARTDVEFGVVNLENLLRDVTMQYRELQAPAAEIEVVTPLLAVRGHESSLGQCFGNLLTNAVKFVAPGVKPRIRIRADVMGNRIRVWLEDNGIGILPEYQARLFRVFERVPTRHAYEGTGIGLAIVRKAMEKMGGTCGVVSDGSSGSRFWIELPKA